MSEQAVAPAAKSKTEYTPVVMTDGRTVNFAGTRQVDKTPLIDVAASRFGVRFDFRSGATMTLWNDEMDAETQLMSGAHGISQKVGDEWSGEKDIDTIVLTAESMFKRLKTEGWSAPREAADSFSGAPIVIKAIVEATGKTVEQVKAFLDGKMEAAKAKGERLTRQELYSSFRNPASKTGKIIKRLEEEKITKTAKFNADELLDEMP